MDNPRPQGQAADLLSLDEMHWQAEREMADALSAFQSQVEPAAELTLLAVVQAAKPAFRLGFSFSVRSTDEGTAVLLMHRSGAQQSAESESYDDNFQLSARLLAGLLGIPVGQLPRPSKAEETSAKPESGVSCEVPTAAPPAEDQQAAIAPEATSAAAPDAEPTGEPDPEDWLEGEEEASPSTTGELDPALEPLSAEEISTLTAMLKELARSDKEAWKRFCNAFRIHFEVPRTARTIVDRITQRRHADFLDRFEQELAAASANAAPAAAEAI
jgi:hypothetical protein